MTVIPTFTERGPYEKGFAELFDREIAPKLDEIESERLVLFSQHKIRLQVTIAATALGAVITIVLIFVYWNSGDTDQLFGKLILFFLPVIIPPVAGRRWMKKLQKPHSSSLRGVIVNAACEFFEFLTYHRDPGEQFDQKRFTELGVVPSGSFTRSEDMFVGRYRDNDYRMIDASVYQGSGRSGHTVFDGLLFEIKVPMDFSGRVLIGKDRGNIANALNKFFKGQLGKKEERIIFDHAAFEERYAVYASDADEALRLINPGFCDTMVALAEAHDTKSLGAAFVDGVFLLALPVEGDLFEPGSITRSTYDCEDDIHEFLEHLMLAHRVIDYLLGDRPPVQKFESSAKHAKKTETKRRRKQYGIWAAAGIGTIVFLVVGVGYFGGLNQERTGGGWRKMTTEKQQINMQVPGMNTWNPGFWIEVYNSDPSQGIAYYSKWSVITDRGIHAYLTYAKWINGFDGYNLKDQIPYQLGSISPTFIGDIQTQYTRLGKFEFIHFSVVAGKQKRQCVGFFLLFQYNQEMIYGQYCNPDDKAVDEKLIEPLMDSIDLQYSGSG